MTHEIFKQILTWCEEFTKEDIEKFLDGIIDDPKLLVLFNLWKQGKQREVFDKIKTMNQTHFDKRKADVGGKIPPDASLSRKTSNKNWKKK